MGPANGFYKVEAEDGCEVDGVGYAKGHIFSAFPDHEAVKHFVEQGYVTLVNAGDACVDVDGKAGVLEMNENPEATQPALVCIALKEPTATETPGPTAPPTEPPADGVAPVDEPGEMRVSQVEGGFVWKRYSTGGSLIHTSAVFGSEEDARADFEANGQG